MKWIKRLMAWLRPKKNYAQGSKEPCAGSLSNAQNTPYEWALTQVGVKEIAGWRSNPQIDKYLKVVGLSDDRTAWCAAFVNWCLAQSGIQGTGKANARSFLKLGKSVNAPMRGDIVVFWREHKNSWKGHVGFFHKFDSNGDVVCLGGNQNNKVCYKTYPEERVLSFRRIV